MWWSPFFGRGEEVAFLLGRAGRVSEALRRRTRGLWRGVAADPNRNLDGLNDGCNDG